MVIALDFPENFLGVIPSAVIAVAEAAPDKALPNNLGALKLMIFANPNCSEYEAANCARCHQYNLTQFQRVLDRDPLCTP